MKSSLIALAIATLFTSSAFAEDIISAPDAQLSTSSSMVVVNLADSETLHATKAVWGEQVRAGGIRISADGTAVISTASYEELLSSTIKVGEQAHTIVHCQAGFYRLSKMRGVANEGMCAGKV